MFSVSTRVQYGIRAMAHLAAKGGESATSVEIAEAQGISPKYLEGILAQLKAAGLVLAERGARGGYRLALPPAELPMLAIVEALEGRVKPVGCVDDSGQCSRGGGCLPRRFWIGLRDAIDSYLGSRTLKDVIEPQGEEA